MNTKEIARLALREMKSKSSHSYKETGNKFDHGQRVDVMLGRLAVMLKMEPVSDTLLIAAWFHDILNGQDDHAARGADKTVSLLKDLCTEQELGKIHTYITLHDRRDLEGLTPEVMLLQDADLLDHYGCFEIWSVFLYARHKDLSMLKTAELLEHNYFDSFERERVRLHFDISRAIYDEKRAYIKEFIDRMLLESRGELIISS